MNTSPPLHEENPHGTNRSAQQTEKDENPHHPVPFLIQMHENIKLQNHLNSRQKKNHKERSLQTEPLIDHGQKRNGRHGNHE